MTKIFNQSNSIEFTNSLIKSSRSFVLGESHMTRFANGELTVVLDERVRNETIVIVSQATTYDDMFELLTTIDAARRSSASEIIALIPCLPHSRQERRDGGIRTSISAKLFADMLQTAGLDRLITMDVHTTAIEGFYNIPFDNVDPHDPIIEEICDLNLEEGEYMVVSPDFGGMKRAKKYATELDTDLAFISKERLEANKVADMTLIGSVKDKVVLIFDDMIDTGGTLLKAAKLLKKNGAKDIYVFVTHGIFSNKGDIKLIKDVNITRVFATNTLPFKENAFEGLNKVNIEFEFTSILNRILKK
jgi:ribose-phosphate pyrophosphokinase